MKRIIILILFTSSLVPVLAQNKKADSLMVLLKRARDTTRVNVLNELSKNLWYYQLDKAAAFNAEALILADKLSYQKGQAEAARCRGVISSFRNDSTGKPYLLKALALFRQLKDKRSVAATLNNLNVYYLREKDYEKAMKVLQQALLLFTELNDQEAIGAVNNQMGIVYHAQSAYSTALQYYLKALAIRQRIGDEPGTAFSLNRVGDMYFKLNQLPEALTYFQRAFKLAQATGRNQNISGAANSMGAVYKQQGNYAEALTYYKISLSAAEAFHGKDNVVVANKHIGEVYQAQRNHSQALAYFQKALNIANKNNTNEVPGILLHMGQVYLDQGEFTKALQSSAQSLELAKQQKIYWVIKEACLNLSRIYAAQKDYSKAYRFHLQSTAANDSLQNEDLNKKLAALQHSLELKNKQTQIDLLTKDRQLQQSEIYRQRQQRIAFIAALAFFFILVAVLVRNNRHKQQAKVKIEKTYMELKATQAQLVQREKMASLGELTAGIAHEIQNPLNFVKNFSEVSVEQVDELQKAALEGNKEEVCALAADIRNNLLKVVHHEQRADGIVKSMLQHSRTTTGEKQPTNINALADEYLRLAYQAARTKDKSFHSELKTHFDTSIGEVAVVPQDIGRVLLNLFNNALYAVCVKQNQLNGAYKPEVAVSTKKEEGKIIISVRDNGNGIPQKVVDKIYQPFFTTKPTGEGTGLGLSLSFDIVRAHGGELKVNTKEGEYAEFVVQLPV